MKIKKENSQCTFYHSFAWLMVFLAFLIGTTAIFHLENIKSDARSLRSKSGILKIALSRYEQIYGKLPNTLNDCVCYLPNIGKNRDIIEPISKSTNCVKEYDGCGGWVYNPELRLLGCNAKGWKDEVGRYRKQITIPNWEVGRVWYVTNLIHRDLTNESFTLTHVYDTSGRVASMDYRDKNSNSLCRISYTYNKDGRITMRDIQLGNKNYVAYYDYDKFGRLVQETIDKEIKKYSYNSMGDRMAVQVIQNNNINAVEYEYQGNLLCSYGDERLYQHECLEASPWFNYVGRLEILKEKAFPYEEWCIQWCFNNWKKASYGFSEIKQIGIDETKTKYTSDFEKNLCKKFENDHWRCFVVKNDRRVSSEIDETGKEVRAYQYDNDSGDILSFLDIADGMNGEKNYYFIRDIQGSVLALVDDSDEIVERYEYDSWGNILSLYDKHGDRISKSRIGNFHLWQGAEYLWDVALYNFCGFLYDPKTGRWLSSLYLEYSHNYPQINLTPFCLNDPVNKIWRCLPKESVMIK